MVHRSGAQTTGGFTTREGEQVLVTPSGEIVGTAVPVPGGGSGSPPPPPPTEEIIVTSGKAVRVGTSTFTGNVIVPGSGGLTANQLQAGLRQQARAEGISGRFTATISSSKPKFKPEGTTTFVLSTGETRQLPTPTKSSEQLRFEIEQKVRERSREERPFPDISDFLTSEEEGKTVGVGVRIKGLETQPFFVSGRDIVQSGVVSDVGGVVGGISSIRTQDIFTGDLTKTISEGAQFGRFGGGVATEFIPTTKGGSFILGGLITTSFIAPPLVTSGIGSLISISGTRTAFDPSATTTQRFAGGLVAVGGGAGVIFGSVPFVRGLKTRVTGSRVTTAEQGFQIIKTSDFDIGLIQPGGGRAGISLPRTSPLRRGGFGVRGSEKSLFLGRDQTLATSQIDFFKVGKDIKLEREFFTTPQEPFLKIPETRVSRLGLQDILKLPKDVEIGFGVPGQAQIGILREGQVFTAETPRGFRIGAGTELEAIKSFGTLTDIKKIGTTTIRGQAVDIFEFRIGRGGRRVSDVSTGGRTTVGGTRISGETLISSGLSGGLVSFKTITTGRAGGTSRISQPISPISPTTTFGTPPTTPPTTPPRIPPTSITPPLTPPRIPTTPLTPPLTSPRRLPVTTTQRLFRGFTAQPPRRRRNLFEVLVRRRGEFRVVGFGRTPGEAVGIGRRVARQTLARTFSVPGLKPRQVRGFRTSQEKIGQVFIQRTKSPFGTTLGTRGEITEIQRARRRRR